MKFKKTRIAFSALCGILCLLLIALWVRSYGTRDWLSLPSSGNAAIISMRGTIRLDFYSSRIATNQVGWRHRSESSRGYDKLLDVPLLRAREAHHWTTFYGPVFGLAYEAWKSTSSIYAQVGTLVTLLAISSLVPWLPWKPWPWRFSLRARLLLTTLVALLLAKVIYFASD